MAVRVDRLRIVCRADARSSARAIAARHRLELVARHHLPDALERAVWLDGAIDIDRLRVRLDFEPAEYDDITLATLWASRIGAALAATIDDPERLVVPPGKASRRGGGEPESAQGPERERLLELIRLVLERGENRPAATAFAVAVLTDVASAAAILADSLPAFEGTRLVARLARISRSVRSQRRGKAPDEAHGTPGPSAGPIRGRRGRPPTAVEGPPWFDELVRHCRLIAPVPAQRLRPGGSRTTTMAGRVERPRPPRPAPARDDRALPSSIAGLALLWPWLRSYLDDATGRRPELDPTNVRRLALAAAIPERGDLVDDPLVLLLAGDDPAAAPSDILVTAADLADLAGPATELVHAFARALPGFAASSIAFIRREFIVRQGAVLLRDGFVEVRIGAMPLDPVLAHLPYPLWAIRLPWTAPITLSLETP